jgi:hypothetical protein
MARHGTRYLKLLRGNDRAAKDRLLQYLNGDIEANYPRTARTPYSQVLWVRPFGFGRNIITGYAFGPPSAADQLILKGVLAPRVAITFNRTATGTRKTSQLTGILYKSYSGNTVIFPFGAGTSAAQKTEDAVFRILLARAKKQDPSNVCSFVPGSWSV